MDALVDVLEPASVTLESLERGMSCPAQTPEELLVEKSIDEQGKRLGRAIVESFETLAATPHQTSALRGEPLLPLRCQSVWGAVGAMTRGT